MRVIPLLLVGFGILGLAESALGQTGQVDNPAAVAARKRQEQAKSVEIVFKQTQVLARGGMSAGFSDLAGPGAVIPASEQTLQSTNRLVLDENKIRYEDHHPRWHFPDGKLLPTYSIGVFDGSLSKLLWPKGMGGAERPTCDISTTPEAYAKLAVLTPLMIQFRGLNEQVAPYPVSTIKTTGATLPIEGAICQEWVVAAQSYKMTFWLDPTQDYITRRMRKERSDNQVEQTDVAYEKNAACGWVPRSWVRSRYSSSGNLWESTKSEVVKLVLNETHSSDEFVFQLPPEWHVYDQRTQKEYLVQPDGTMRERIPGTDRVMSDSIRQPGDSWYGAHKWQLCGMGVLGAFLVWNFSLKKKK